jgi:hypothetical protein
MCSTPALLTSAFSGPSFCSAASRKAENDVRSRTSSTCPIAGPGNDWAAAVLASADRSPMATDMPASLQARDGETDATSTASHRHRLADQLVGPHPALLHVVRSRAATYDPATGHPAGRSTRFALLVAAVLVLAGTAGPAAAVPEGPPFPSPAWTAREAANFALTGESAFEQLKNPDFVERFAQQSAAYSPEFGTRKLTHSSFVEESNLCATWSGPCTGDPFRYPGVDPFYKTATAVPVEFTDRGGTRSQTLTGLASPVTPPGPSP